MTDNIKKIPLSQATNSFYIFEQGDLIWMPEVGDKILAVTAAANDKITILSQENKEYMLHSNGKSYERGLPIAFKVSEESEYKLSVLWPHIRFQSEQEYYAKLILNETKVKDFMVCYASNNSLERVKEYSDDKDKTKLKLISKVIKDDGKLLFQTCNNELYNHAIPYELF